MPDHIPLPAKQYSVIYADPPWAYSQGGNTKSSHGIAKQHYPTMTTAEICALPVREIVREGAACFMWATFPNITEAIKVMEAWGFTYKTAAFVWVKKNRKQCPPDHRSPVRGAQQEAGRNPPADRGTAGRRAQAGNVRPPEGRRLGRLGQRSPGSIGGTANV